jgi:DNA-binding FadR family transcriptional regulator
MDQTVTLSDQVAQQLRARIAEGAWQPGMTLPPERRLAEELGVSRGSLRGGIAQLQAEGLVEARQGSGTRVRDDLSSAPVDWISWVLANDKLDAQEALLVIEQLVGLRRTVALHVLEQALDGLNAVELERFEILVDAQGDALEDPLRYQALEHDIERFFIRLAGNRVVPLLNESLRRCFRARPEIVDAFMGPLHEHHIGNQALLGALRMVLGSPGQRSEVMSAMTSAVKVFEAQGLARVRKELEV